MNSSSIFNLHGLKDSQPCFQLWNIFPTEYTLAMHLHTKIAFCKIGNLKFVLLNITFSKIDIRAHVWYSFPFSTL